MVRRLKNAVPDTPARSIKTLIGQTPFLLGMTAMQMDSPGSRPAGLRTLRGGQRRWYLGRQEGYEVGRPVRSIGSSPSPCRRGPKSAIGQPDKPNIQIYRRPLTSRVSEFTVR